MEIFARVEIFAGVENHEVSRMERVFLMEEFMWITFIISWDKRKFVIKKKNRSHSPRTMNIHSKFHGCWSHWPGVVKQDGQPNQTIYSVMPKWTFNHYPSFQTEDCSLPQCLVILALGLVYYKSDIFELYTAMIWKDCSQGEKKPVLSVGRWNSLLCPLLKSNTLNATESTVSVLF